MTVEDECEDGLIIYIIIVLAYSKDPRLGSKNSTMMLLLILAVFLHIEDAATATCKLNAAVIEAVTNSHNELRANVAKRNLSTAIFGDIPG
ncbi:unnamed protein product [Cylicocyclus nassatus]|uniref:Uncharacterized protein n=1 Tax=Cylicocyclus nassatus TaxID=53992 RepID=A0AA36M1X4_CYLNA|nr:unnamed protein product [Cylicocyclus nassatus]